MLLIFSFIAWITIDVSIYSIQLCVHCQLINKTKRSSEEFRERTERDQFHLMGFDGTNHQSISKMSPLKICCKKFHKRKKNSVFIRIFCLNGVQDTKSNLMLTLINFYNYFKKISQFCKQKLMIMSYKTIYLFEKSCLNLICEIDFRLLLRSVTTTSAATSRFRYD